MCDSLHGNPIDMCCLQFDDFCMFRYMSTVYTQNKIDIVSVGQVKYSVYPYKICK